MSTLWLSENECECVQQGGSDARPEERHGPPQLRNVAPPIPYPEAQRIRNWSEDQAAVANGANLAAFPAAAGYVLVVARRCAARVAAAQHVRVPRRLLLPATRRRVASALRISRAQYASTAGVLRLRVLPPPELHRDRDAPLLGEPVHFLPTVRRRLPLH
jgi:hypothetical protein